MAKITIVVENELEPDGCEDCITLEYENVDDLYALSYVYLRATQAMGYNYVSSIVVGKNSNEDIVAAY